jgi:GAF domain-containing protein
MRVTIDGAIAQHDATEALADVMARIGADSGTVHWLGSDGLLHLLAATPGLPDQVLDAIRVIPVGKGMAGLAVERREPVTTCNIQSDTSGDVRPGARATGLAGALVVPIFDGDHVVGALGAANRTERSFSDDEVQFLLETGRRLAAEGRNSRKL